MFRQSEERVARDGQEGVPADLSGRDQVHADDVSAGGDARSTSSVSES